MKLPSSGWTRPTNFDAESPGAKTPRRGRPARPPPAAGELGGDATHLAGLIGDLRGAFLADIEYQLDGPELTVRAGDVAEASGTTMVGPDGTTPVQVAGVHQPPTTVTAGTSTRSKVNVEGLAFDNPGYGLYSGPFELKG